MDALRRSLLGPLAAGVIALGAACTSSPASDFDAGMTGFVNAPCSGNADCRAGLQCLPATLTCQPPGNVVAGGACVLTAECAPGLYCNNSVGACAPAGDTPPGAPCTDTASCVRGAVCVRATPGLYGVCQLPRGTRVSEADGGATDAGFMPGTARDIGGLCLDVLDCLAGLLCATESRTCVARRLPSNAPDAGVWLGAPCDDTDVPATAPARAFFEVPAADGTPPHDFFRLPFPNDVRRDATTGRVNLTGFPHPGTGAIGFDLVDRYARASERDLTGFGTNQQIYFRFSRTVDFSTLTPGGSLQLIDLPSGAGPRALGFSATNGRDQYVCPNYVALGSGAGVPLAPGHTYAAFVTTAVRDDMGRPLARDADFAAMLAPAAPADARLARAYTVYAPFREYLATHNISPDTIAVATVFTTQQPTAVAASLRAVVRATPAPALEGFVRCDTGVRSPCDDGLTGPEHVRGCMGAADPNFDELQGRVTLPVFQRGTRPYGAPGEGAFVLDATGQPQVQSTEAVCVTVTVPRGAPAPTGGWPVVLYAHGTGGTFRSVVSDGLAAALASVDLGGGTTARLATVGYEGVMHGPRRGAGVTDSPDTLFFNFANPEAARDNVLQGAADVSALIYALATASLPMLPTPADTTRFDAARIMFVGHSQGATVGAPALAYEPNVPAIVLSGAGGDLRVSLTTKRHPVDFASLIPFVLQDPSAGAGHPAVNLLQAYFERSDAVNYAPLFLFDRPANIAPRSVLQTYGLGDTYSSEGAMQSLASAMGLPILSSLPGAMDRWPGARFVTAPVAQDIMTPAGNATALLIESDPAGAYDGHFVLFRDTALQRRVAGFLASATTGVPSVR